MRTPRHANTKEKDMANKLVETVQKLASSQNSVHLFLIWLLVYFEN